MDSHSNYIYVRFFDEDNYYHVSYNNLERVSGISTYLTPCTANCILNHIIPKDNFVICPIYKNGRDFQIGVTGGIRPGEYPYAAIVREAAEEVGILLPVYIDEVDGLLSFGELSPKMRSEEKCWLLSLDKGKSKVVPKKYNEKNVYPEAVYKRDENGYPVEITTGKVGVIIHGNSDSVTRYLGARQIYRLKDTDDIIGVVALPVHIAQSYVRQELIQDARQELRRDNFFPKIIYYR